MSDAVTQPHEPTVVVRWPRPRAALLVLGGEHDLYSAPELRQTVEMVLP
jgi:hypothetical protein